MSGFDPFLIEQKYNETIRLIQSSPSERIQLKGINTFIEEIWDDRTQVSSYLEQLLQYLPDLSNPLLIAGINPLEFKKFVERLEIISEIVDADMEIELKLIQYNKSLFLINSWVGEDQNKGQGDVIQLEGENKPTYKPGEVLIPVVEELKTTNSQTGIGRLRQLRVDILGENKKGKSELKPAFGVVGKDSGSFLDGVSKVSEKLLSVSKKGKHKQWRATASLSMSHAWHAGRSANLALAAAFYCEMLKAEEMAEFFRLNPAICVTGDVDEYGNVLAVDEESLELKTEAAFFSWVQVLVVPTDQLEIVQNKVRELNERFPNRQLPVFGVNKIQEMFYDRRLTIHQKTDAIIHNLRKVWKRKFGVATAIVAVVLIGIIARLVYGPVDRNPSLYNFEGRELIIKNKTGGELQRIEITEFELKQSAHKYSALKLDIVTFIDVNKDGINEILLNRVLDEKGNDGTLMLLSSDLKDTLWVNNLEFDIPFEKHPYAFNKEYFGVKLEVDDLDSDGVSEIILSLQQSYYFKSVLGVFSSETGKLLQNYKGTGFFSGFEIEDFDKDGEKEIFTCGLYKGFKMWGCSLLNAKNIDGFTPLGERYLDKNKPRALEKFVIIWPSTIIGKKHSEQINVDDQSFIIALTINRDTENIYLTYSDTQDLGKDKVKPINLIFSFDYNFNLKAIASSDYYDNMAQEFYEKGITPFLADAQYLHSFRDSVLYWNGTEFQSQPTLNKKYLEAVGEDSTFYKQFYFNTYE